jgi:hypothetical protein
VRFDTRDRFSAPPAYVQVGNGMTAPGNSYSGGIDNMATLTIDTVKCIRKQDVMGKDEPILYIAGQPVWNEKMGKGDSRSPKVSRAFSNSVIVELKEQDNNQEKSLGKWTIEDTPTIANNAPLTATSSGYHYEVHFDVV